VKSIRVREHPGGIVIDLYRGLAVTTVQYHEVVAVRSLMLSPRIDSVVDSLSGIGPGVNDFLAGSAVKLRLKLSYSRSGGFFDR